MLVLLLFDLVVIVICCLHLLILVRKAKSDVVCLELDLSPYCSPLEDSCTDFPNTSSFSYSFPIKNLVDHLGENWCPRHLASMDFMTLALCLLSYFAESLVEGIEVLGMAIGPLMCGGCLI